ncbi:COG4315 family predicted lipoprotein [Pseudomonas caspiana]
MLKISSTLMGLLAAAALASSGLAFAAEPGMTKGGMLTDHKGLTLYTYDKDAGEKSACNGPCAENWPPLMATETDKPMGKWTIIKRDDGSMQWAYGGKPVYKFKSDEKAGDMTGDGKGGAWHVIKP